MAVRASAFGDLGDLGLGGPEERLTFVQAEESRVPRHEEETC